MGTGYTIATGGSRRARALGATVVLCCLAFAFCADRSHAAVGDLTYQGCLSGETQSGPAPGTGACGLIPSASASGAFSGLQFLQGIVVSPDGTSVYAVAESDDAIAAFARDPATGALTYQGCISGDTAAGPSPPGSGACALISSATVSGDNSGMDRVRALAMSPDGAHLYAVAHNDDSLLHFSRDESSGALAFGGCLTGDTDVQEPPCGAVGGATAGGNASGFNEPFDLVVFDDSLYVVTQEDDSIIRFGRASNTGSISYGTGDCFTGELATGPTPGSGACVASPTVTASGTNSGFDKPRSVTMSPDGTSVYVAAPQDDSVAQFDRDDAGALTYQGCITAEEATGPSPGTGACTPLSSPVGVESQGELTGINNPQSIIVSPDGASLYLASGNDTSVARFGRAASGALTYQGCITGNLFIGPAPDGNGACASAPVMTTGGFDTGLDNMRDVVVSPDGASVYASSAGDSAVVTFSRDGSGAITFAGCTSGETETGACSQIPSATSGGNDSGMGWVQAVAPSQDGTSLYYIAQNDHAVGRFTREVPPPPPDQPVEGDTAPPDTAITDSPKKKTKTKNTKKKAKAKFEFTGTDARAVASFQCRIDKDEFSACTAPFKDKVKKGRHHFEVRAIDAAGNVDPTPATYDWKVKKKKRRK